MSKNLTRLLAVLAANAIGLVLAGDGLAAGPNYREQYRPQFHYTPAKNWMNDPNGLVRFNGLYHMFYQYNPFGDTWGNISWGHATSRDFVHWNEQPIAIPVTEDEMAFSGSVVIDWANSSGFGVGGKPPLVAIYTSFNISTFIQAQSLAYSTDEGRTWTRYAQNPVLDIGSTEFRDPKVFWHAPTRRWIMAVVLAVDRKVQFYRSTDLKRWTLLSEFGPANAVGGVWEVPDLFELPVEGTRGKKWVLVVNMNPGAVAGGSGTQYFIGEFDGTTFTAENVVASKAPTGTIFEDFEGTDYGGWTATGDAFGTGPASGSLPGQGPVTGFVGNGLVNSFHNFDAGLGTLTSPAFEIDSTYISLLVGGGSHPLRPGTGDGTPPPGDLFEDFEGPDYGAWTVVNDPAGQAFGDKPYPGTVPGQQEVSGFLGSQLVNSFLGNDAPTGKLTSPAFTLTKRYVNLLVGGGPHRSPPTQTAVNLIVDDAVVASASGQESEALNWVALDAGAYVGQQATIEIVDQNTGGWGHILADQIILSDTAAKPRPTDTTVNLIVEGKVVRTATGENSEQLDWVAWKVDDLRGKQAQIQIVDNNNGSFGHILVDQVVFGEQPGLSVKVQTSWADYGKDFYAAVSWYGLPERKRTWTAWMSNWQYANGTPTSPWRSAQSIPRQLSLKKLGDEVRLVQKPSSELRSLRTQQAERAFRYLRDASLRINDNRTDGKSLEVIAEFQVNDAKTVGLKLRSGADDVTIVGYDVSMGELFVDRTDSGDVAFNPNFPGRHAGPLTVKNGRVTLHLYIDASSVEVFGGEGETVITDQIFPGGNGYVIEAFAGGGGASLRAAKVWSLKSIWR